VPFEGEIEATKAIAGQGISTALHNDSVWTIYLHDFSDDRLENTFIRLIINTITKRKVKGIVFSLTCADVSNMSGSRKVFSKFVERNAHHSISSIKCLLYTVSMVDIISM